MTRYGMLLFFLLICLNSLNAEVNVKTKPLAWASFKQQAHESYKGISYLWLGHGDIKLTIDVKPAKGHALDLYLGAKQDKRSATISINGYEKKITAGGYDGFQWQRITIPAGLKGDQYQVSIKAAGSKAAFIAKARLVLADKSISKNATWSKTTHQMKVVFQASSNHPNAKVITDPLMQKALRNGEQANQSLRQCRDFVRGWLAHADPQTGLIPRNLGRDRDKWNGRDSAADNYPFMVLTCALVDQPMLDGRMLQILKTEKKLTSRIGNMVDWYSLSKKQFLYPKVDLNRIIFDSSEYVKDGLMPLTEWLGKSPWSLRMVGIIDDIWKHAPVDTPFGKIPSTNDEVNGEMMQVTARLFWMTGKMKYLDDACRIADWYLLGDRHPTRVRQLRLRDHGCELISGLSEVYYACHYKKPEKASQYRKPMHEMLDRILAVGVNEHGMMFNAINPITGAVLDKKLSDNWGYNYNAFYTVYLVDQVDRYRDAVIKALTHLNEHYRNYKWEGWSHDGYADSIECAINLYNREPVASAADWIDSEMQVMLKMQRPDGIIGGWHGDGNFARTAIMYALWKQQGVTVMPWRADVKLGGVQHEDKLYLTVKTDWAWQGKLRFDPPRHKSVMGMPTDYPRINQFPQWFVVETDQRYQVKINNQQSSIQSGKALIEGLAVNLKGQGVVQIVIESVKP